MTDQQNVAVLEPPVTARPKEDEPKKKPKRQPPYAVIVLNDDRHTFAYVIETFMKVFGYSAQKSFLLAEQIHTQGRANVWSGAREVAELKREQIISAGTDYYAEKPVKFPLGVLVEPLPG
ncbi:MAG: ATP-dependent Clp protease adaptor ClpS [Planctomycetia bacterium]|nr:ATP-dependent Clp protease adaptor ClpS [Planctomycetia bacterium]